MLIYAYLPFFVLSMALIQSEIVRPQVITAKCSELQADNMKVEVKEIRIILKADVNGALNIMRKHPRSLDFKYGVLRRGSSLLILKFG